MIYSGLIMVNRDILLEIFTVRNFPSISGLYQR